MLRRTPCRITAPSALRVSWLNWQVSCCSPRAGRFASAERRGRTSSRLTAQLRSAVSRAAVNAAGRREVWAQPASASSRGHRSLRSASTRIRVSSTAEDIFRRGRRGCSPCECESPSGVDRLPQSGYDCRAVGFGWNGRVTVALGSWPSWRLSGLFTVCGGRPDELSPELGWSSPGPLIVELPDWCHLRRGRLRSTDGCDLRRVPVRPRNGVDRLHGLGEFDRLVVHERAGVK